MQYTYQLPAAMGLLQPCARFLTSEEGDVIRLAGIDPPEYSLRTDDYRVRFYDHGESIEIVRVRHRREACR